MNPFQQKYEEFSKKLTTKNAEGHAEHVASKSGEVFKDRPFSDEFKTVYAVAQWGQSVAQVVTYLTTAALGVFALTHIIPLWWGIYIAVPLGLLFAFGVEKVKRSTLAIASKHLLKYKQFGFVGVVALLVMLVSIAAALYGAKELPGVVYPKPTRAIDGTSVSALTADIDRVQADIDRLQGNLKSGKNWVGENRTLPKLQAQRAALVEKRDVATKDAAGRGDTEHLEAIAERQEKVDKMQVYAVGAAIVAELIFLLCTAFVFYYLFRHFAEQNQEAEAKEEKTQATQPATRATVNGRPPVYNLRAAPVSVSYTPPITEQRFASAREDVLRSPGGEALQDGQRHCAHCSTVYTYGHARQRFCTERCRIESWQDKNGKKIRHKINAT